MNAAASHQLHHRRQFFTRSGHLLGGTALASLIGSRIANATHSDPVGSHFAPTAKRVIYLHMVGGPAQMDLFDYKPVMKEWYDKDLPDSVRMGQRLTTMTSGQKRFPIAPTKYKFRRGKRLSNRVIMFIAYDLMIRIGLQKSF